MAQKGYTMVEDSGRGWRRVVPSPDPKGIVEKDLIQALLDRDAIVIAAGGGGIPVVEDSQGMLRGIEAVIDKDLAGARLAGDVNADILLILTDVEAVAINWGKPDQPSTTSAWRKQKNMPLRANSGPAAWGQRWRQQSALLSKAARDPSLPPSTRRQPLCKGKQVL